jgi:hypothetical protein
MPTGDNRDLIEMGVATAMAEKYRRGREVNGSEWVGPRPLVCLHDEILDSLIYADLEYYESEENREVLLEIIHQLVDIRRGLLVLLEKIPKETWDQWTVDGNKWEKRDDEAGT